MDGRIPSPYNINLLMHRNGMYIACCVVTLEFGLFAPGDLFNNRVICSNTSQNPTSYHHWTHLRIALHCWMHVVVTHMSICHCSNSYDDR